VRDRAPERLAAAAGVLLAAAAAVLLLGSLRDAAAEARAEEAARITGGIGGGSALVLSPCEAGFEGGDPGECGRSFEPVPGGRAFCPHHSGPGGRR